MVFPCWYVHFLSVASPSIYGFLSFMFFHMLQSSFRYFVSCCFSYLHWLICCLLHFLSLGYAPYFLVLFLFVRRLCLSSSVVFLVYFPDFDPYFLVRSLHPRFLVFFDSVFIFCTFGTLQYVCPASSSLLCSPFLSSTSTPLLRPPFGFPVLSLLLSSPERLYSSSWFFLWLL